MSVGVDAQTGSTAYGGASVQLDWVLFDFGARDAGIRQAREAMQSVLDEQRAEVLVAVAQAAQLHTAAQSTRGRADAAAMNMRIAQDSMRVVGARHAAGAATLIDRLQAQRALSQATLDHTGAMTQWLTAAGALSVAMGLPAPQPLVLAAAASDDELIREAAPDVPMLIDEAMTNHPRLLAARGRLTEASERSAEAQAERWGAVGVGVRIGRGTGDTSTTSHASAGIAWTVPLFDRDVWGSKLRDAQGQARVRAVGVEDAVRLVTTQVWQEGQNLLGARNALHDARQVLDSAETTLRVTTERFRLGASAFAEILLAQDAASIARFQWVDVRANLLRARWRLAAAVGRLGPMD